MSTFVATPEHVLAELTTTTTRLLSSLSDDQRGGAHYPFSDTATRHRWTYRPRPRAGLTLGELTRTQRTALHRMLASVLSAHAHAQVVTIMAFEDVLDQAEDHRLDRHHSDYWIVLFGTPGPRHPWGWRFEGHHLSINITVHGQHIATTPCFFGANPATIYHRRSPVAAPLHPEEHLGRELLAALGPTQRRRAIISDTAPEDIRTRTAALIEPGDPAGVAYTDLASPARAILTDLTGLYLDRFHPALAGHHLPRRALEQLRFAWEGHPEPGHGHYYRIHAPNLLIEYDNTTNNANHIHTVLRHPATDFGHDLLTQHHHTFHSHP